MHSKPLEVVRKFFIAQPYFEVVVILPREYALKKDLSKHLKVENGFSYFKTFPHLCSHKNTWDESAANIKILVYFVRETIFVTAVLDGAKQSLICAHTNRNWCRGKNFTTINV